MSGGGGREEWLSRSVETLLEEAELSGRLELPRRGLREFPPAAARFDLSDTLVADLSGNRLGEVPGEVGDWGWLEELDLRDNGLLRLPAQQPSPFAALRFLDLSHNRLRALPAWLCSLSLEVLDVSHNRLTALPQELGRLGGCLRELNASSNALSALPGSLAALTSLQVLSLRDNQLSDLPGHSLGSLKLLRLDLSHNRLRRLPAQLSLLGTLRQLRLEDNPLEEPPLDVVRRGFVHALKWLEREGLGGGAATDALLHHLVPKLQLPQKTSVGFAAPPPPRPSGQKPQRRDRASRFNTVVAAHPLPSPEAVQRADGILASVLTAYDQMDQADSSLDSSQDTLTPKATPQRPTQPAPARPSPSPVASKPKAPTPPKSSLSTSIPSPPVRPTVKAPAPPVPKVSVSAASPPRASALTKPSSTFSSTAAKSAPLPSKTAAQAKPAPAKLNGSAAPAQAKPPPKVLEPLAKPGKVLEDVNANEVKTKTTTAPAKPRVPSVGSRKPSPASTVRKPSPASTVRKPSPASAAPRKPSLNGSASSSSSSSSLSAATSLSGGSRQALPAARRPPRDSLATNHAQALRRAAAAPRVAPVPAKPTPVLSGAPKPGPVLSGKASAPSAKSAAPPAPLGTTTNGKSPPSAPSEEDVVRLRESLEAQLPGPLALGSSAQGLATALADGVLLCQLANRLRARSVPTVHLPSPSFPDLPPAKGRRNLDNFVLASRRLGVAHTALLSVAQTSAASVPGLAAVARNVAALLSAAQRPATPTLAHKPKAIHSNSPIISDV